MKKLLPLLLLLNTVTYAQSDSLGNKDNWSKQHKIGVELGGKLFFYALNYEFCLSRYKSNFSIGYGLNFFKTPYTPIQGNTVYFKYLYGVKNQIFIEGGQSVFIQKEGFNDNFKGNIWEKPQPFVFHNTFSIGYSFVFNKTFSIYASPMIIYIYGKKYNYSGELKKYKGFMPYFNIGVNFVL